MAFRFFSLRLLLLFCGINFCLFSEYEAKTIQKRGIMDNINSGIKYAGQVLGINTISDVADLVAKAFAPQTNVERQDSTSTDPSDNSKSETANSPNNVGLLNGFLRLLGLDNNKLGALAINGIIMIAQMIGNMLMTRDGDPKGSRDDQYQPRMTEQSGRQSRNGLPLDWILDNPSQGLSKVLEDIKDPKLSEYLAQTVSSLEGQHGDGDCVKLLLCKSAPFIWGMQKSVMNRMDRNSSSFLENDTENENGQRLSSFFKYLPDVEEYKQHGKKCEERYANCNLQSI